MCCVVSWICIVQLIYLCADVTLMDMWAGMLMDVMWFMEGIV